MAVLLRQEPESIPEVEAVPECYSLPLPESAEAEPGDTSYVGEPVSQVATETLAEPRVVLDDSPGPDPQPEQVEFSNHSPIGAAAAPALKTRLKVLAIDDDAVMRKLLKMGLAPHGYECETAENGKAAQEVLRKFRPDLILVDLLMPVMDGLSFINWLRQTARDTTPVLVFTNLGGTQITQEALRSGANSVASKPLHFKELLQAMRQLVPA